MCVVIFVLNTAETKNINEKRYSRFEFTVPKDLF